MNNLTERIRSLAAELDTRLVSIRQTLHRHPEVSGEEVWTTQQLRYWLAEAGITVLDLPLRTGLVAEIKGALPGPTVALRTDIDALPVQEETGLACASEIPGKMHACGHDFHMATILGAAFILQELRAELPGTVRILCQPAEETASGAVDLIKTGALQGVSAVFGLHNKPDVPSGTVGIKAGPLMANVDTMLIEVAGKGGHGAVPDLTIDPVVAGSAIVMALQTAVSRNLSPLDPAVVSVCSFQAGSASNVIPMSARLLGTVRSFTPAVRTRLKEELLPRIVRDVAAGYGCTATLQFTEGTPAVDNDAAMAQLMHAACAKLGLPVVEATPTMGGEDFAEYQQVVPGCFVWMGTGCPESWHHPKFMVDERVIHQGAALFAQVALEALTR
ncbi:MAG TPA: amidohydrolase [Symbiobacteriaceae bacterium]|jgi:amidohydrolase|nr:amidohydrolase [Symbiobacteriaceae bacterium]